MPNPGFADERQRAVLAAVLAVKRGFLSPDEAMGILEQVEEPKAPKAGGNTLLNLGPGDGPVIISDASSLLLAKASPSARAEIVREVESLTNDPARAAETLGFDAAARTRLNDRASVKQTLLAVAASTDRVPRKATSARLQSAQGAATRYEIKRELARGGMGRVLIAMDNAVGREVALKELLPERGGTSFGRTTAGELAERFLREAKVTGQLEHPNIIPVYEIGAREDGSVFYTMKLIRGKTLADRIAAICADKALSPQAMFTARLKLLDAFVDACNAMAYAHSRGVIHRDLKPANVMLGDFGETLVLDWGLARVKGQADEAALRAKQKADTPNFSPSLVGTESESRTLDGSVIGTPAYMSPEQARGELAQVDEQSDVYSLGATLYEIITGKPPYVGPSANLILGQVQNVAPKPIRTHEPQAAPDLCALVEKAMAREKTQRLASAQQLGEEVRAFIEGRHLGVYRYSRAEKARRFVARNKLATAVSALALVALAALGTVSFLNVREERDAAQFQLARAEQAERERLELQRTQTEAREKLVANRKQQIESRLGQVSALDLAKTRSDAEKLLATLKDRKDGSLGPVQQAETRAIVSKLLDLGEEFEQLSDLYTEPIAGQPANLVAPEESGRVRRLLQDVRLLAAALATANEDFALSEFILRDLRTIFGLELVKSATEELERARGAQLKRHAEMINSALSRIRGDRAQGASFAGEFNELISRLSVLRERQTVELLAAALKRLAQKAREKGVALLWTQPERDEITLICRVLSNMEMPDLTVEPLSEFLDAVDDDRLAIEAAVALCLSGSWEAEAPITRARKRFEQRVLFWNTVGRLFVRIPDPPVAGKPQSAAEYMDRGWVRHAKGKGKEAYDDLTEAIAMEPRNAQAYYMRAGVAHASEEKNMADLDKALELDPKMAKAWVLKAFIVWGRNNFEETFRFAHKATEVDPSESTGWAACGGARMFQGRYRESIVFYTRAIELNPMRAGYYANRSVGYIELREYERGIVDCTSALDLDPFLQEAWVNRAAARMEIGDLEGALNDATRIIELVPRYGWGYAMRGKVRMKRREFAGAEYDFARAIEFVAQQGDFMYRHVLALRAQKRFDEACTLALKYASNHASQHQVSLLKRLRECILLEKRGSLTARPEEVAGVVCFECAAAQLGEVDRAAPDARFPRRLAVAFVLRGLATLPRGEGANEARVAGELVGDELITLLSTERLYADIDAVAQALYDAGIAATADTCYNRACSLALAAAAADARNLKVLGERDDPNPPDFKSMPAAELAKRVAALKERAFTWLERAVNLGCKLADHAREDTDLAALRDDPRFDELIARMK